MKKSEAKDDVAKIIERIEALKNADCLSDKLDLLEQANNILEQVSSALSLGMHTSITGRKNSDEKCRFCGK